MQRTVYGTENCQPILAGMARIALNARLLVANKLEGIGWFTHECFSRIAANHPEHQFLLLFDRRPDSMFDYGDHVEVKHLWPPARRPMLYDWWFDYSVTRAIRRWNADVFVSTDGFLSRRTSISQLAVIHDLNFMHHPEWMPPREARYYRNRFPQFALIATRLATVSAYSQNDLVEQFGLDQQRIDVVPNAPAADYAVLDEEGKALQCKRWSEGSPYFIFVGSLHPRKNIEGLLAAFAAYKAGGGQAHLVVVGSSMWTEEMRASADVHWVGRLDRVDLALAMGGALGLVYLPWFEGFGVPIVEAFACGIPVIASNVTSIPEVCGGAEAALVAPDDAQDAAHWMERIERDASYRQDCVRRGLDRAQDFTWDLSADLLWQSILKTLPA